MRTSTTRSASSSCLDVLLLASLLAAHTRWLEFMLHSFPKFDVHACLNATLHRFGPTFDNATINVLLDVGDAEVFNRTYPIGKIEKECVRVKKVIDICADFSDLNITDLRMPGLSFPM